MNGVEWEVWIGQMQCERQCCWEKLGVVGTAAFTDRGVATTSPPNSDRPRCSLPISHLLFMKWGQKSRRNAEYLSSSRNILTPPLPYYPPSLRLESIIQLLLVVRLRFQHWYVPPSKLYMGICMLKTSLYNMHGRYHDRDAKVHSWKSIM